MTNRPAWISGLTPELDVYETLRKLDSLVVTAHDDPSSPIDWGEYRALTNELARGTAELLAHIIEYEVLRLRNGSLETMALSQIELTTDCEGRLFDEIVIINRVSPP